MSDSRPTLDQRRAQHAWQAVERASKKLSDKDKKKEFAREAKRLPVRIKTAGLGQALAFLNAKAKDGDARGLVLTDLGDWLLKERRLASPSKEAHERKAVIQAIIAGDADLLRRATEEALLYLQWLTRFSEAEFKPDESNDNDRS